MDIFARDLDPSTIDFSAKYGASGQDDFSRIMFRRDSTTIDIERIRSPKEIEQSQSPQKKLKNKKHEVKEDIDEDCLEDNKIRKFQEDTKIPIYERIKRSALARYRKGPNYSRYFDMATKYLMSKAGPATELRFSLDALAKSDSKIFGQILIDFPIVQSITIWSDVINLPTLERRDAMHKVPNHVRGEWERTKLSQNTQENVFLFKLLAEHAEISNKLQILHLVGVRLSSLAYNSIGYGLYKSNRIKRFLL